MKKAIFFLFTAISLAATAQESRPPIVPPKNVIDIKKPQLPQNPVIKGTPIEIQPTIPKGGAVAFALTSHSWTLTRWWVTQNAGHSITAPAFSFLVNGVVQCRLTTPEAKTVLESGTYTINGNNIRVILKKDTNVTMDCNLVYDAAAKKLTGTYSLQVLPIANPPAGYTPGTVTGDMALQ